MPCSEEAIEAGGSTLRDFASAEGSLGYFQHRFAVYGREGEPCLKARVRVAWCGGPCSPAAPASPATAESRRETPLAPNSPPAGTASRGASPPWRFGMLAWGPGVR